MKKLSKKSNQLKKAKRGQRKLVHSCVSETVTAEQLNSPFKSDTPEQVEPDVLTHTVDAEVYSLIENHDEKGLSRAKAHWFFGEWQKLAELDESILSQHPDRDRMALLVASAHQQLDDHEKAKKFSRMALAWGCPNRIVAQVLISGIHNTLGRIHALKKDNQSSKKHFSSAINIIKSEDADLVAQARSIREISSMGLIHDAAALIDNSIDLLSTPLKNLENQKTYLKLIREEQKIINFKLKSGNKNISTAKKNLILIASIPRSGSTWTYNCAREILKLNIDNFYSCWVNDYDPNNDSPTHLVKVHEPDAELAITSDIIISTRRDIRSVAASLTRMSWAKKNGEFIDQLNHITNVIHPFWHERTSFEIEYNQIINNSKNTIEQMGHLLGKHLTPSEIDTINRYLLEMESPSKYCSNTQFHPNHRSEKHQNPEDILGPSKLKEITTTFLPWLKKYGYAC
mgnify:CR=1 FL=1